MYVNDRQIAIESQWVSASGAVVVVTRLGHDSVVYVGPDDTEHATDCIAFVSKYSANQRLTRTR